MNMGVDLSIFRQLQHLTDQPLPIALPAMAGFRFQRLQ